MPRLTVYFVRTALLYLAAGFGLGALMLSNKGLPYGPDVSPLISRLLYPHIEIVLFGWTMQLAMGVALWIFPRFSGAPKYGPEHLGWRAYVLLNIGIMTTIGGHWFNSGWLVLAGRVAEVSAIGLFLAQIWTRVKPISIATIPQSTAPEQGAKRGA